MVRLSDVPLEDIMPAINEKDLLDYKNSSKDAMIAFEERAIDDLKKTLADLREKTNK